MDIDGGLSFILTHGESHPIVEIDYDWDDNAGRSYHYVILRSEVARWCEENHIEIEIEHHTHIHLYRDEHEEINLYFDKDVDLIIFKLRWL